MMEIMLTFKKGFFQPPVLIILAIISISLALVIYVNTRLVQDAKEKIQPAAVESPKTSPAPVSNETANPDSIGANWKTYTSTKYSFSYPPNLKINPNNSAELLDENEKLFLSIYSFDPAVVGISYCGAYPNDKPRCEQLKVGDKIATIDWNGGKANAILENLSLTLNMTNNQTEKLFKQILSTFQFIN